MAKVQAKQTPTGANISAFLETSKKLEKIEGWFLPGAQLIFDFLLAYQHNKAQLGNLFEIGVWHGKSASLMAKYLRDKEQFFLIDHEFKKDKIEESIRLVRGDIPSMMQYLPIKSNTIETLKGIQNIYKQVRFMHIDGEHSGEMVYQDMETAHKLLSNDGVLVMDDFFNPAFPQVTEAVYRYLHDQPYHFKMFICGYRKAFLCRVRNYQTYYSLCMTELPARIRALSPHEGVFKTSSVADCDAMSIGTYPPDMDIAPNYVRGPDWDQQAYETVTRIEQDK